MASSESPIPMKPMPTAPDPSPEYDATAEPPPYPTPAHPSIQRPRNLQLPPQGRTSVNLNFTEDNTSTEPRSRRHYLIPCVCFWPFLLTGIGVGAWLLHLQNMTSPHCTPPVNLSSMSSTTLHTEHEHPHGDPPSYPSSLHGVDYWIPPPIEDNPNKRRICYRPKYIFAFIGMGVITMARILGVVFATLRKRPTT